MDNIAITSAADKGAGRLNVWGNSLAAEWLPEPGGTVEVADVPFAFPACGDDGTDNVVCRGQPLAIDAVDCEWAHLLAAAERRVEDFVTLHYADGSADPEWLRVSDFWAAPPAFGEMLAFESPVMHYPHHEQERVPGRVWAVRVPVPRRQPLAGIRLPVNPAIHVFACTLELAPAGRGGPGAAAPR